MEIFWKVPYVSAEGDRSERLLCCRTEEIDDPTAKAQVELASQLRSARPAVVRRFRHLFEERQPDSDATNFSSFHVLDYWEDEAGQRISLKAAIARLQRVPEDSILLVSHANHYAELQVAIANGDSIYGEDRISFAPEELQKLRRFTVDAMELKSSRFFTQPGAFSLSGSTNEPMKLQSIEVEHINHFITVFRRLYGQEEPANYDQITGIVAKTLRGSPFARWLAADRRVLNQYLGRPAHLWPLAQRIATFKVSQLISNFMYGGFLHQPKGDIETTRAQWASEAGGLDQLKATFYAALHHVSCHYSGLVQFTKQLCENVGADLARDGAGNPILLEHTRPDLRLMRLSEDERNCFERHKCELATEMRDRDASKRPIGRYLEEAQQRLLEILS